MQQPGQSDVVRPEGPAGDEVRILLAATRLADLRGRWTFLEGGHRATAAVCSESAMVRGGGLHRSDDVLIPGTPAEVPFDSLSNLRL